SEFGAFVEIDRAWPPEGKGLARRGAPSVKRTSVFGFSCFLDQNQSIGTLSATRCLVNTAHSGNRFGTRICAIVAAAKQGRTAKCSLPESDSRIVSANACFRQLE